MSLLRILATLSITAVCLLLPGCHQRSSPTPATQSAQHQTDEERDYEKFRKEVESTKKRVAYPGHPGQPNGKP